MRVRVLGCYGSASFEKKGPLWRHYSSSCLQVNETVLIDSGTIHGPLNINEMENIRAIFITHAHLDHICGLPFMAETLYGRIKRPVVIASTEEILASLKRHIFNDIIWPDFTAIPNKSDPVLRYQTIKAGVPVSVEGLKITAIQGNHTVPTVGYLVKDSQSAFIYSGDTYKTVSYTHLTLPTTPYV